MSKTPPANMKTPPPYAQPTASSKKKQLPPARGLVLKRAKDIINRGGFNYFTTEQRLQTMIHGFDGFDLPVDLCDKVWKLFQKKKQESYVMNGFYKYETNQHIMDAFHEHNVVLKQDIVTLKRGLTSSFVQTYILAQLNPQSITIEFRRSWVHGRIPRFSLSTPTSTGAVETRFKRIIRPDLQQIEQNCRRIDVLDFENQQWIIQFAGLFVAAHSKPDASS